jgi:GLPGLI family protein
MTIGMGINSVTILNAKTNEIISLMDMMGTKTATIIKAEDGKDKDKKSGKENDVKLVNETKEIAGYTCSKAIMTDTDGTTFELFYTDKILSRSQFGRQWNNFNGFPMEYQVASEGLNMKLTAKLVSAEKVPDDLFKIPEGYKLMTQEEFSKMLGEGEK